MKVYNRGTMVSREIDLDLIERGPTQLIAEILEACVDLEDVRFESEVEVYNYGDTVACSLVVYGKPTGELAEAARKQWEERS